MSASQNSNDASYGYAWGSGDDVSRGYYFDPEYFSDEWNDNEDMPEHTNLVEAQVPDNNTTRPGANAAIRSVLTALHTAEQSSYNATLHDRPVVQPASNPLPAHGGLPFWAAAALHDRPIITNTDRLHPTFSSNWSLYQQPNGNTVATVRSGDNLKAFTNGLEVLKESEMAGQDCGICLLRYEDKDEEHGPAVCLPCHRSHACHRDCLRTWLEQSPTCPHCREKFPECHQRYTVVEYNYTEEGFGPRD